MQHGLLFKLIFICLVKHVLNASINANGSDSVVQQVQDHHQHLDVTQTTTNNKLHVETVEPNGKPNAASTNAPVLASAELTKDDNVDANKTEIEDTDKSKQQVLGIATGSATVPDANENHLTELDEEITKNATSKTDTEQSSEHPNKSEIRFQPTIESTKTEAIERELIEKENAIDELDTPGSIAEFEEMFPVNPELSKYTKLAKDEYVKEPTAITGSGDGQLDAQLNLTSNENWLDEDTWPQSSGDDQIESHASGDGEFTTSPLRRMGTGLKKPLPNEKPPFQNPETDSWNPPEPTFSERRKRCEDIACENYHHLQVTASPLGGSMIPAGVVLKIRCAAQSPFNGTAIIKWHLPPRMASGDNDTLNGDDHSAVEKRINVTEEVLELRGTNKRVTISTLSVVNVTEEDAGAYICAAVLTKQCCQSNRTVGIRVYTPPSYAVDFAIVGAVCFIEFLIILYFKTRSDKQSRPTDNSARPGNGYSADYTPLPLADKSKEVQIEEEQQRLT